ncbi:MAG: hypothetical protein A2138_10915 [Deltaproteobacteria bacterium RBG_16_71_12]|nr:MAG: hypothetical protein A2138_10915 [Deltaproteobacteria bacterium RBG_16_71_12]
MLLVAPLLLLAASQEPGYGGAPVPAAADEPAPVDESPGQAELRARLTALERAATPAQATAAAPAKRTKLEEELERAHLDPTLPLLALRIEVARAEEELAELTRRLARPDVVKPAEERVARLHEMSDLVERIALARLVKCTRAQGRPVLLKTWRMTAGGPVALSAKEMIEQAPNGDPDGCERIVLIDADTVAKARRLFALRAELQQRSFGYHAVAERKALEAERDGLERALEQQALAGTFVANPPR